MWNVLLPSILTLGGALIGASANTKAAERGYAGQVEGANITANAIREGNAQAQQTLNQIRTDAGPARSYLRTVIADPGTLTPAQMEGLEEVHRSITNQINNSSFADRAARPPRSFARRRATSSTPRSRRTAARPTTPRKACPVNTRTPQPRSRILGEQRRGRGQGAGRGGAARNDVRCASRHRQRQPHRQSDRRYRLVDRQPAARKPVCGPAEEDQIIARN